MNRHEEDQDRPDQALHPHQPRRRATWDPGPEEPAAHLDPGRASTLHPADHLGKVRW